MLYNYLCPELANLTSLPTRLTSRGTAGERLGHYLSTFREESDNLLRRQTLSSLFYVSKRNLRVLHILMVCRPLPAPDRPDPFPFRFGRVGTYILCPLSALGLDRRLSECMSRRWQAKGQGTGGGSPMVLVFPRNVGVCP